MNIKKGMFRFWIVLTLAWLPIAVTFLRPKFPEASWYMALYTQRKLQEIHSAKCSVASYIRGECDDIPKLNQNNESPINKPRTSNESVGNELTGDALFKYEQAKTRYWVKLVVITTAPPISLLMLGLLFIYAITPIATWVIKGFRNN